MQGRVEGEELAQENLVCSDWACVGHTACQYSPQLALCGSQAWPPLGTFSSESLSAACNPPFPFPPLPAFECIPPASLWPCFCFTLMCVHQVPHRVPGRLLNHTEQEEGHSLEPYISMDAMPECVKSHVSSWPAPSAQNDCYFYLKRDNRPLGLVPGRCAVLVWCDCLSFLFLVFCLLSVCKKEAMAKAPRLVLSTSCQLSHLLGDL